MTGGIILDAKYRRIVLKLSGEALAGEQGFGINPSVVEEIAAVIAGAGLRAVLRAWIVLLRTTWA